MSNKYKYSDLLPVVNVHRQLRSLIKTEKITPTKRGWKDIRYLRRLIARMEHSK